MKKLNKFIAATSVISLVGATASISATCNPRKLVRVTKEKWDEYKKKKEEKKKAKEAERNKEVNGAQ